MRRAIFLSMNAAGSNPRTSAAILTGYSAGSNREMVLTPERPATKDSRKACFPKPTGEMTPIPVTTTRLSSIVLALATCLTLAICLTPPLIPVILPGSARYPDRRPPAAPPP